MLRRRLLAPVARLVREHRAILALAFAGCVIRTLVVIAYQPAFWYYGDSGSYLILSETPFLIDQTRPLGYVFLLKALRPTGTLFSVVALQHAIGVGIAFAVYALLLRRGAARWQACLAAVPLLFDALLIVLEHYVLAELLFVALLLVIAFLLLWPQQLRWGHAALAGVVLFAAWFVRPVAIPLVVIVVGYLLVRRAGMRAVAAFLVTFLLPFAWVLTFVIGDEPSAYGSSWSSRSLYGRVAPFADCSKLTLTPAEQVLCPSEPVGQRPKRGDWYVWNGPLAVPGQVVAPQTMSGFAWKAIRAQPADYLRTVTREAAQHFLPLPDRDAGYSCLRGRYEMPATARGDARVHIHCHPELGSGDFQSWHSTPEENPTATSLTTSLNVYSKFARTPALVVLAVFVATAVALLRRPLTASSRDAAFCTMIAGALIVGPVFVSMYEVRYSAPALPFVSIAAILTWKHLRKSKQVPAHAKGGTPASNTTLELQGSRSR